MLKTTFWRKAAGSLPDRYRAEFEDAERFELALDSWIEAWKAITRFLHFPHPRPN